MGWRINNNEHARRERLFGVALALSKCQGRQGNTITLATPETYSIHSYQTFDMPTGTITERMEFARVRSGLSYASLSDKMNQHRETISKSLSNPTKMRSDRFFLFCKATNVDPCWIMYGDDAPVVIVLPGNTIGQKIASYRKSIGISTRTMAKPLEKQSASITAWEKGRNIPQVESLIAIGEAFGISAVSFFPTDRT